MPFLLRILMLCAAAAGASPAVAQDGAPRGGEPAVERKISEDDNVRIEELRVRGETQRIVVRNKLGGPRSYEIVPAQSRRDPSQDKGASGQRVWHILSF